MQPILGQVTVATCNFLVQVHLIITTGSLLRIFVQEGVSRLSGVNAGEPAPPCLLCHQSVSPMRAATIFRRIFAISAWRTTTPMQLLQYGRDTARCHELWICQNGDQSCRPPLSSKGTTLTNSRYPWGVMEPFQLYIRAGGELWPTLSCNPVEICFVCCYCSIPSIFISAPSPPPILSSPKLIS